MFECTTSLRKGTIVSLNSTLRTEICCSSSTVVHGWVQTAPAQLHILYLFDSQLQFDQGDLSATHTHRSTATKRRLRSPAYFDIVEDAIQVLTSSCLVNEHHQEQ